VVCFGSATLEYEAGFLPRPPGSAITLW